MNEDQNLPDLDINTINEQGNAHFNTRLTALWALSEAALGGVMHFFHVPFKGAILSGIAVFILSLLCRFNAQNEAKIVLRSLVVVLAVKLSLSPQSPPTAYLAVTFQAFFCLVCYRFLPNTNLAGFLSGIVCLIESALQKLFVASAILLFTYLQGATAFHPKNVGDQFLTDLIKDSAWLAVAYVAAHGVVGAWVGFMANNLPHRIDKDRQWLLSLEQLPKMEYSVKEIRKQEKEARKQASLVKRKKSVYQMPVLLAVLGILAMIAGQNAGLALLRAAMLWLFFLTPFVQQKLSVWIKTLIVRRSGKYATQIAETIGSLPEMKTQVRLAWQIARKEERNRYYQLVRFVPLTMALILTPLPQNSHSMLPH